MASICRLGKCIKTYIDSLHQADGTMGASAQSREKNVCIFYDLR